MLVKEKMKLCDNIYGSVHLKRWKTEEGFYIEYTPNTEDGSPTVYAEGKSLVACIENITDECPFGKKELFSMVNIDEILETFDLSDTDKKYIIDLDEWIHF